MSDFRPRFLTEPEPARGTLLPVLPGVGRLVARNAGPMTYWGTNTYLLDGEAGATVIDPGPDDAAHVADILRLAPGPIRRILLTHRHPDHVGALAALQAATSAAVGEAGQAGLQPLDTPGHAPDHLCFARTDGAVFSGDHVMGWSSTSVSPPDGDMAAYFASLRRLLARPADRLYLPGHGPPVPDPLGFTAALLQHRAAREEAVLAALAHGPATPAALVETLYRGLSPALRPAAARTVLAHLLKLAGEGRARPPTGPGERWQRSAIEPAAASSRWGSGSEDTMADVIRLNPHDPAPDGGHTVFVMRRFEGDDPHRTLVEITLTHRHGLPERTRPMRPDGTPMALEEAVEAARRVADEAGIPAVQVIDRVAGPRERDIQQHGGDHTVHMDRLDDDDLEEGERGPDMRR